MNPTYKDMQKLDETELLSLAFRETADTQVVKSLLTRINAMEDLLNITMEELDQIEGMEDAVAEQFLAAMQLSKRIYTAPTRVKTLLSSPNLVADFFMPQMRYLDREVFKCLHLNRKNGLLFTETVSIGSLNATTVHPREVFKNAIKRSAAAIILAHNHPSGDPSPSREDIEVTKRLVEAGKILGILVLDHIIIGDNQYYSLKASGLLDSEEVEACLPTR